MLCPRAKTILAYRDGSSIAQSDENCDDGNFENEHHGERTTDLGVVVKRFRCVKR
jgi:hypothetical protein